MDSHTTVIIPFDNRVIFVSLLQNPTFPSRLEIPQKPRDSHFPTAPTAAGRFTQTGHFDLLTTQQFWACYEIRTQDSARFLMEVREN